MGGAASIVFPCVAALKANAGSPTEQGKIQGAVSCLQSCCRGVGPLVYGPLLAWLVGPHAPGGRPRPQLLWGLSVLLLLPALAAAVALQGLVDDDAGHHAQPVIRRTVSLFRRGLSSRSLGSGGASPSRARAAERCAEGAGDPEAPAAPPKPPLPGVRPRPAGGSPAAA
ncbi:unnamed protein product [Prorocentrum cordatum]|uniref:Solute carrier family 40 protein n=1 Tax=Prorocentrum cordatum TaxID=2364126 RepID=A0ABN9V3L6_9DINO|nr:unnamed protein product [Polarella glacialis]